MHSSIYCFLIVAVFNVSYSHSYDCRDRHCFVTTNNQNEKIFDCALGKAQQDDVICFYNPMDQKLILSTKDQSYVKIDKIAPGALKRLVSGIVVQKFSLNKFQVTDLSSNDFDGLSGVSELTIENPKSLAFNSFLSIQSKKLFILTISCAQDNFANSFNELFMNSNRWRLFSTNCNKTRICEFSDCENQQSLERRIISTNHTAGSNYQLTSYSCKRSSICLSKNTPTKPFPKSTVTLFPMTTQSSKSAQLKVISPPVSNSNYDTLMWIVLFLTGINSIVILGMVLFLIIWWQKLTSSAANKKHTIILEDGSDTKYLKLSPYA